MSLRQIRIPATALAGCILAAQFVALAALTWRKWPDVIIDFGRELYIPWQLSLGRVLYTDVAHICGPASQYFNALLFSVFGTSYTTLIWSNLCLVALETFLVYTFFRDAADRLAGILCASAFLSLFAFAQLEFVSNYNFISPYSHEATHGIIVATLMVGALSRAFTTRSRLPVAVAGLSFGMVFLMKQDIFAAAALVVVAWSVARALERPAGTWVSALSGVCQVTAFATPVVLTAWIAFALKTGTENASAALTGYWASVFNRQITGNAFYLHSMGLDYPDINLVRIVFAAGLVGLLVQVLCKAADISGRMFKSGRRTLGCGVLAAAPVLAALIPPEWAFGSVLLPGIVGVLAVSLYSVWRPEQGQPPELRRQYAVFGLWCVFALGMMPRMLLNPRLVQYGFYLGMPAGLALVAFLVHFYPLRSKAPAETRVLLRAVFALFVAAIMLRLIVFGETRYYAAKTATIGSGADLIRVYSPDRDRRTAAVRTLLAQIEQIMPPDASIVVLPEGVMLNYLSRRANSTPYHTFMVPEMRSFGESTMLASLERTPPHYIILFHKNASEYGVGVFGSDPRNGQEIMRWVRRNYAPVFQYGEKPLVSNKQFGAEILKHQAPASDTVH